MVALHRRATEGGSYVVATSLTQAGMAVERMGRAGEEAAQAPVEMLLPAEVEGLSLERDTAYGHIKYLAPVVRMSETPPRWELPTVRWRHMSRRG